MRYHRKRAAPPAAVPFDPAAPGYDAEPTETVVPLRVEYAVATPGNQVTVTIIGELDIATHTDLRSGLSELLSDPGLDQVRAVRIDLCRLTFCDAQGACLLLELVHRLRERGLVSIENPTAVVRRILLLVDPATDLRHLHLVPTEPGIVTTHKAAGAI